MDYKLELLPVPVTDVDRAKAFYADQLGFVVDVDDSPMESIRVVQLTPPGSACSIMVGTGITRSEPGSLQGPQLVVDDIEAAREELAGRGVDVSPSSTSRRTGSPTARVARGTHGCSSATPTATAGSCRNAPLRGSDLSRYRWRSNHSCVRRIASRAWPRSSGTWPSRG